MIAPDCPAAGWTDPISEQAVLALVQTVQKEYRIDNQRLLITGYSMGATGTWDYVFKHPGLFSAAIPISGMPPKGIILKASGTMILAIHSRDDELFPLDSLRKFIRACQSQEIPVELRVVAGLSHYHFDQFVWPLRETVPRVKALWESPSTPKSKV